MLAIVTVVLISLSGIGVLGQIFTSSVGSIGEQHNGHDTPPYKSPAYVGSFGGQRKRYMVPVAIQSVQDGAGVQSNHVAHDGHANGQDYHTEPQGVGGHGGSTDDHGGGEGDPYGSSGHHDSDGGEGTHGGYGSPNEVGHDDYYDEPHRTYGNSDESGGKSPYHEGPQQSEGGYDGRGHHDRRSGASGYHDGDGGSHQEYPHTSHQGSRHGAQHSSQHPAQHHSEHSYPSTQDEGHGGAAVSHGHLQGYGQPEQVVQLQGHHLLQPHQSTLGNLHSLQGHVQSSGNIVLGKPVKLTDDLSGIYGLSFSTPVVLHQNPLVLTDHHPVVDLGHATSLGTHYEIGQPIEGTWLGSTGTILEAAAHLKASA